MKIPKILHQTWKTATVPDKWVDYQQKVQDVHPDWEYRLWTDADCEAFVQAEYPDFYDIYMGFSRNIMRADVIRYLIMYKMGGMYLDLDYEFLKPFDFKKETLVLPKNRSFDFGDEEEQIGNCVFASVPGERFWLDVITDLKVNTPKVNDYTEIVDATGPKLLTKIYYANPDRYRSLTVPGRLAFHPPVPRSRKEYQAICTNGISYGIHHGWGSWKERWSWAYWKRKVGRIVGMKM